jgi:hypothetical protein
MVFILWNDVLIEVWCYLLFQEILHLKKVTAIAPVLKTLEFSQHLYTLFFLDTDIYLQIIQIIHEGW